MRKKLSLIVMVIFYIFSGVRHFMFPDSYYSIMPPYIPYHTTINILAGVAEILLAILMVFPVTRKVGATGIIVLLIIFIPTHIYMIEKGGCMGPEFCIPAWVAWTRLFPGQFLLILWAWWHREDRENKKGILE